MRPKTILELLPVHAFMFFMSFNVSVPPVCCGAHKLMRGKKHSLCCYTEQLAISSQWSIANHRRPWARPSERMSEAWFSGILQACPVDAAVVLADALEPVASWP
jgi:hypothetical protein